MNPAKRKKLYRISLLVNQTQPEVTPVQEVTPEVVAEPVVVEEVKAEVEPVVEAAVEEVKTTTRRSKKVVEPVTE